MTADPIRERLDQLTARRRGKGHWSDGAPVLAAALRAVLDLIDLCNDCQHGYAVPVEYLQLEVAAALGVLPVEDNQ